MYIQIKSIARVKMLFLSLNLSSTDYDFSSEIFNIIRYFHVFHVLNFEYEMSTPRQLHNRSELLPCM